MKALLALVFRIEPGVGIGAEQLAPLGGRGYELRIVDFGIVIACGVEEVGDVDKERDGLWHEVSFGVEATGAAAAGAGVEESERTPAADVR